MRTILIPTSIALLVLVAGCNRGAPAGDGAAAEVALPADTEAGTDAPLATGDGVTAIDAALGDSRQMPSDHYGPSAYDRSLASERGRPERRATGSDVRDAPGLDNTGVDLLGDDDTVTSGE